MAGHVALLGDSIFDNGVYVPGEPDVARQLQDALPDGWQVTLLAVDGAVTSGVERQLGRLPSGASHLVVSVGGNDALGESHLLTRPCRTIGEGVARLAEAQASFAARYHAMVEAVLARGLPTALCTIYDANYPPPQRTVIVAALALFNDVITRAAFSRALPLIDLRLICSESADYANPIEPSARGGARIAAAIARLVTTSDESGRSTVIASG
jgi:lysophospholipase L1-like esterase